MEEEVKKPSLNEIAVKHNVETVFEISLKDKEGNPISAFFKKPSRQIVSRSISMQDRDPLGAKEFILRNCFLEGNIQILDNDDYFFSACTVVDEIVQFQKAILKKN